MRLKRFINESEIKTIFPIEFGNIPLSKQLEMASKMIDLIVSDCKPYLNEIKKLSFEKFLLSGRGHNVTMYKEKIRKDRRPTHTPMELHVAFDNEFKKKFGWKPRSQSLFCTGNYKEAAGYGYVYAIFPIGDFKYLWSPKVVDLYASTTPDIIDIFDDTDGMGITLTDEHTIMWKYGYYIKREIEDIMAKKPDKSERKIRDEIIKKYVEKAKKENETIIKNFVSTYKNTNLSRAILSNNEIMIGGNEYYGIRYDNQNHDRSYGGSMVDILFQYLKKYGIKKPTKEMIKSII